MALAERGFGGGRGRLCCNGPQRSSAITAGRAKTNQFVRGNFFHSYRNVAKGHEAARNGPPPAAEHCEHHAAWLATLGGPTPTKPMTRRRSVLRLRAMARSIGASPRPITAISS